MIAGNGIISDEKSEGEYLEVQELPKRHPTIAGGDVFMGKHLGHGDIPNPPDRHHVQIKASVHKRYAEPACLCGPISASHVLELQATAADVESLTDHSELKGANHPRLDIDSRMFPSLSGPGCRDFGVEGRCCDRFHFLFLLSGFKVETEVHGEKAF